MKILYIITQADGGGAQNYVLALAKHFQGAIAAGTEAEKLFEDAKQAGLETFTLKYLKRNISPWHDFWAVWEIRRLIKTLKPDVVHLNSTKAGVLGSFACMGLKPRAAPRTGQQSWTGARVVFTAHGFRYNEPLSHLSKNFYLALEKIASSYRDYIICVSNADRISALKQRLISPEKIHTVYNGLPALNFLAKDEARTQLNLPGSVLVCGNTSNFYKSKGQDILIQAAATLPREIIDKTLFVIFGNGPEFENLKFKIRNLKLENSFKLFGQVPNARIFLKALDVFVLPSRKEGFPFALLEAMQAGLPVITTDVGGNKEALGDAGVLIKPEDPKLLAAALINLIQDNQKRQALSAKASQRSALFTENKMLEETRKIYEQTLKG